MIAVALDPESSVARSYLGRTYAGLRLYEDAFREWALAESADPNDPTAPLYRAFAERALNRPIAALERHTEIDRAERQPRGLPLAAPARPGPRHAHDRSCLGLSRPRLRPARAVGRVQVRQLSIRRIRARTGSCPIPIFPLPRHEIGERQRAASVLAASAAQRAAAAAAPRARRAWAFSICRALRASASTNSLRSLRPTD